MILKCRWCKKDFKGRKEAQFCDKKCSSHIGELNRIEGKTKFRVWRDGVCENCEKSFRYFYESHEPHRFCSKGCSKLGDNNPQWKGDDVGLKGLHIWVRSRIPKTEFCVDCNIKPPYDIANISQEYKRDLCDWEWLCRSCHMNKDGRMKKLHENNKRYQKFRTIH